VCVCVCVCVGPACVHAWAMRAVSPLPSLAPALGGENLMACGVVHFSPVGPPERPPATVNTPAASRTKNHDKALVRGCSAHTHQKSTPRGFTWLMRCLLPLPRVYCTYTRKTPKNAVPKKSPPRPDLTLEGPQGGILLSGRPGWHAWAGHAEGAAPRDSQAHAPPPASAHVLGIHKRELNKHPVQPDSKQGWQG